MRKYCLIAFCLILPGLTFSSQGITSLDKEMNRLFEKVKPSVVSVKFKTRHSTKRNLVTTGVLVDREGHLLTTKNFSGKPKGIRVELEDGEEREAEWIGWDQESKLAVLKVKGKNLIPATIGNSDLVKPASWAMIVGNSMGLSPSISIGHISGKRKGDLLQLNAHMSPGNSGAGVFNTKGELIGIVAASLSSLRIIDLPRMIEERFSPGGSGVAIPINRAMEISKRIIEKGGDLEPGWLGVYIQDLDDDLKESLDADHGALVSNVVEDSPAEAAGMKEGDVIVAFKGEKIEDTSDLQRTVRKTQPDTKAKITVLRKGKKKTLTAKIGERTDSLNELVFKDMDIEIRPPDVKLFRNFSKQFGEDGKFREEMKKFKKEMKDFRKEMRNLKKELTRLKKKKT
ncbi:trypsin-like peptidase domain-containing protein [candidate division TA06 bacterium]|nr:trypsin-like peptidase domain-containing protein [candidate division TA06 bacterium]